MSFRQNNETKRKWDAFCQANKELIERIGLPGPTVDTWDRFADLLMHGYIDHHSDPTDFVINKRNPQQMALFRQLVDRYFEAGFVSPGMDTSLIGGEGEWVKLVRKYPSQFGAHTVMYVQEWEAREEETDK